MVTEDPASLAADVDGLEDVDQPSAGMLAFSHERLASLREYQRLLRSISAFSAAAYAAHGMSGEATVQAVHAAAAAVVILPSACPRCSVDARPRFAAPYAAELLEDGGALADYRCMRCGTEWRTEFDQEPTE